MKAPTTTEALQEIRGALGSAYSGEQRTKLLQLCDYVKKVLDYWEWVPEEFGTSVNKGGGELWES